MTSVINYTLFAYEEYLSISLEIPVVEKFNILRLSI